MKKSGGKRAEAGRCYNPWKRISLANRFAELKWSLREAGRSNAAEIALELLHEEEHPDGGGSLATTRRLIVQGRHDDIFINELAVKRDSSWGFHPGYIGSPDPSGHPRPNDRGEKWGRL